MTTCCRICGDDRVTRFSILRCERLQRRRDGTWNVGKANATFEKERDGFFIGCVEDCWRGAAGAPGGDAKRECGEIRHSHALEGQGRYLYRVKGRHAGIGHSLRMGKGVEHGKFHAWHA